jgi:hypothetical protein
VFPEAVCVVRSEIGGVDERWWLTAPALLREIGSRGFVSRATGLYRLGDAVLQVGVDDPALLEIFAPLYADCAVSPGWVADIPAVRCTIQRSYEPPLVVVTFQKGAPPDPAAAAYNLLRPTQAVPPFEVSDSPMPGWRLAGGVNGPVLVARDAHVLLHPKLIPPEFLAEYLVGITLGAQPWTLPIHGASLQMGGAGVMLVGASRAGKTTTSLHLASRGHALLGDEIALIRLATGEVVPFRRTVNVRGGPHGCELAAALGRSAAANGSSTNASWTGPHRITELFPGRHAGPVPLRAAFFLGGFADQPSLEPFQLSLDRGDVLGWITTPEIAYCSWGLATARRAFRLVVLKQVLSRIPCWLLKLGRPLATAELIERTMEELSC